MKTMIVVVCAFMLAGCSEEHESKQPCVVDGCSHTVLLSTNDPHEVSRVELGRRLHVSVRHGPSRESGWIYPVGYPEFYLEEGDTRADDYIREAKKKPCFCKGDWWLVTNGWVEVTAVEMVQEWHFECGILKRIDTFTNYVPKVKSP